MDLNKFAATPSALLSEATVKPEESAPPPETPQPSASSEAALKNTVGIDAINEGNKHTTISTLSPSAAAPGSGVAQPGGNSVAVGAMVEGKLAVELMDSLLPGLFVAMFYAMDVKLRKSELQLTEKEKATISPLMQNCLNSLMLNFNSPWSALGVTVAIIYGSKLAEKGGVAWIDKLNEKKERAALEEKLGKVVSMPSKVTDTKSQASGNSQQQQQQQQQQQTATVVSYTEQEVTNLMKSKRWGRARAEASLKKKYGIA